MRISELSFNDTEEIKSRIYAFTRQYQVSFVLDSNGTDAAMRENRYELLAGFGERYRYEGSAPAQMDESEKSPNWKFLILNYGSFDSSELYMAEPELVFCIPWKSRTLLIMNNGMDDRDFERRLREFEEIRPLREDDVSGFKLHFTGSTHRDAYVHTVDCIRQDIIEGRYYEINYCIGFSAVDDGRDMLPVFRRLNAATRAPFAAYVSMPGKKILCSSPERFLMKERHTLLSQPIKGTSMRLEGDANKRQLKELSENEKERAENVMIVDLVRNDLSRVCRPGTVSVRELCGAYAYRSVNHLVSSISGELREQIPLKDIFRALFPMGSMTGAPKIEVMKHIERYEAEERGIYSGCIGYINPGGDFDFNVVIRTLIGDETAGKVSYKVGSAVTFDSEPSKEYEECLLKGNRLEQVFGD